ncbi:MAG TPA: AsmA family protein [Bryobacteraceae bacterium]|nr:AsmA family protein [Bryobacteraceae bacterium]
MRKAALIVGIVIVLLLGIAIALPFFIDANTFRPTLEAKLTQALGRDVKIGDLELSIFSESVAASDLSIADDPSFSKTPFLRAESFKAGVELMPLIFSRKLNVTGIEIGKPQIDMIQNPSGAWNFSSIGATSAAPGTAPAPPPAPVATTGQGSAPPDLTVAQVQISGGRLTLRRLGTKAKPIVLENADISVKQFSPGSSFPFSLSADVPGGGKIKLDGTAGPIDAGNTILTPVRAKLSVTHLDLLASGALDPSTGISGIASIDGNANSSNGIAAIQGKLEGKQLVLTKGGSPAKTPVRVDFAVKHNLTKQSGVLQSMNVHIGSAAANLSGTYRLDTDTPSVDLKLTGSKMAVTELAALLPALDIRLPSGAAIEQGAAGVNLTAQGPLDNLVTSGTLGVENTRLANYDLASKLKILHNLSGIKAQPHTTIQLLSANVKNSRDGTALENIQLVIPAVGQITGAGTISPAHVLDFKMRLAAQGGTGLLSSIGATNGIPFTVQGTSEDPSIRPDVKGLAHQELKGLTGRKSTEDAAKNLLNGLFGGKKKQQ